MSSARLQDQMERWKPEWRELWAERVPKVQAKYPSWSPEFCELHAFRSVREHLVTSGALSPQDVPTWRTTNAARTPQELRALPRDEAGARIDRSLEKLRARDTQLRLVPPVPTSTPEEKPHG